MSTEPKTSNEPDLTSSTVRRNLMTVEHYSPYCGNDKCGYHWPRTTWGGKQFGCRCGWVSDFEPEFIAAYKAKWHTQAKEPQHERR